MPPEDNSQSSSNLPSFAEALAAASKMQQDWLEHVVNLVDRYVEDVEGDWLDKWGEDEPAENGFVSSDAASSQHPLDHDSFIKSIVTFLMSDDPLANATRPFWKSRPLPKIAAHLERYLTLPKVKRLDAIQDLLNGIENSKIAGKTQTRYYVFRSTRNARRRANPYRRRSDNATQEVSTLKLSKDLLEKLLQVQQEISYRK